MDGDGAEHWDVIVTDLGSNVAHVYHLIEEINPSLLVPSHDLLFGEDKELPILSMVPEDQARAVEEELLQAGAEVKVVRTGGRK